jgi:preprotein translocase subunit SecA
MLLGRNIAEMRTGEGKTLTITIPAAIQALEGKGVHVVTANEYLAARDTEQMRPVYAALGLTVGVTLSSMSTDEKAAAYACDVTYGVGSEFGFDYLKDNLVREQSARVQRGLFVAVIDEVDSILIDEARVPLIIAETAIDYGDMTRALDACVKALVPEHHYLVNLKERSADLTEEGYFAVERDLVERGLLTSSSDLYAPANLLWARRLHSSVRAYALYRKNRDYVVADGKVVLIDAGTGRSMADRRLEDGLHEALEAREGLDIKKGTVTKATITYQSYFGMYRNLSGLTGTAATDAEEFAELYNLKVVVVPTNKPVIRTAVEDLVYLTKDEKFKAAVEVAARRSARGQPVLIGCASIRDAEVLDKMLTAAGLRHNNLTAKHVAREAEIIGEAGRPGAVTVATNMAGRGTDFLLGGEPPRKPAFSNQDEFEKALDGWEKRRQLVVDAGGLFVLGTERNGLRRIDNQLAGRSGRQGAPGEVQFLLSLEDELLKVFGQTQQLAFLRKMLQASKQVLGGNSVSKLVITAQKLFEGHGFAARKALMKYDTVLADQRNALYDLRAQLLEGGAKNHVQVSASQAVDSWASEAMPLDSLPETWDAADLKKNLALEFGLDLPLLRWVAVDEFEAQEIVEKVQAAAAARIEALELDELAARSLVLEVLDEAWAEHLTVLKELQENANLKGNGGLNPGNIFNKEAFELFKSFEQGLNQRMASRVLPTAALADRYVEQQAAAARGQAEQEKQSLVASALGQRWVGRNEPCPCESAKRFKDCHGKL